MGFQNVRKMREETVASLIEARNIRSFTSIEDFILRTRLSKDVLENLAMTNAFQCWRIDRRHSFWQSIEFQALLGKSEEGQLSLFDETNPFKARTDIFPQMSLLEEQTIDYRKKGYSLDGNFMRGLRLEMLHLPSLTSTQARRLTKGKSIRYAGILTVLQRPPPANGTAFITLEDEWGSVDLILRSETYEKYKMVIKGSRFLVVEGKVQRKGSGMSILVSNVESFSDITTNRPVEPGESPRSVGRLDL
jgi:error-prone DNA polymerase